MREKIESLQIIKWAFAIALGALIVFSAIRASADPTFVPLDDGAAEPAERADGAAGFTAEPLAAPGGEAAEAAGAEETVASDEAVAGDEAAADEAVADEAAEDGQEVDPAAAALADPAALREYLRAAQKTVLDKLAANMNAKRERQMGYMSQALSWFSLAGLLLLLMPLFLRRRYPGHGAALLKYSAIAAVTFVLAVNLFSAALMSLRHAQGATAAYTNPQAAMVQGAFETLDDNAEDMAPMAPALLYPTLQQLEAGSDQTLSVALLDNLQAFREDVSVFTTIGNGFRGLSGVLGYLPIVLSVLTVVLFLLAFRTVLIDIAAMPARAIAGGESSRALIGKTARTVGREIVATFLLIATLVAVTMLSGVILVQVVKPAMEALLAFILSGFFYMQLTRDVSTFALLLSIGATGVFLVLTIAAVLASNALFLGKAQKIFRLRMHEGVPLRANSRFWKWGTASLVWAQVLPLLFMLAVVPLIEKVFGALLGGEQPRFLLAMVVSSLMLLVGLAVVFWAARGLGAVMFLARFKPVGASYPRQPARAPAARPAPMHSGYPAPVHVGHPAPVHVGHPASVHAGHPAPMHSGHPVPVHAGHPAPMHSGHPAPVHAGHPAPMHSGHPAPMHSGHPATVHTGHPTQVYGGHPASPQAPRPNFVHTGHPTGAHPGHPIAMPSPAPAPAQVPRPAPAVQLAGPAAPLTAQATVSQRAQSAPRATGKRASAAPLFGLRTMSGPATAVARQLRTSTPGTPRSAVAPPPPPAAALTPRPTGTFPAPPRRTPRGTLTPPRQPAGPSPTLAVSRPQPRVTPPGAAPSARRPSASPPPPTVALRPRRG